MPIHKGGCSLDMVPSPSEFHFRSFVAEIFKDHKRHVLIGFSKLAIISSALAAGEALQTSGAFCTRDFIDLRKPKDAMSTLQPIFFLVT